MSQKLHVLAAIAVNRTDNLNLAEVMIYTLGKLYMKISSQT